MQRLLSASLQDPAFVQFPDFLAYVKRMETVEVGSSDCDVYSVLSILLGQATKSSDVAKEMEGMKVAAQRLSASTA